MKLYEPEHVTVSPRYEYWITVDEVSIETYRAWMQDGFWMGLDKCVGVEYLLSARGGIGEFTFYMKDAESAQNAYNALSKFPELTPAASNVNFEIEGMLYEFSYRPYGDGGQYFSDADTLVEALRMFAPDVEVTKRRIGEYDLGAVDQVLIKRKSE